MTDINVSVENKLVRLLQTLNDCVDQYSELTFSSSLSAEDMIITDVINRNQLPITIFTIDTGRLPKETYELLQLLKVHYQTPIVSYVPDSHDLENYLNEHGCNAFYQSIDYRKLCCSIRKIGPLKRALKGNNMWVTGLRREQSITRQDAEIISYDPQFQITKCNPLFDWSQKEVWSYIKTYDVPYNALHDRGFPSIGCAPCTRKIEEHEEERAGRWWWESPESKECGLHQLVKA